jgi:hypothetical protein
MEESKMKKHVTVVGAIHIGIGVLSLIGAVAAFFALRFAMGMAGEGGNNPGVDVLRFVSVSVPLLIVLMATLALVGGIGLFTYKPWARYLVIVVAALGCLFIPIGTLSGVYALWVLLQDDTVKLFEKQ